MPSKKLAGSAPESSFPLRSIDASVLCNAEIDPGTEPLSAFIERSISRSAVRAPIVDGIGPVNAQRLNRSSRRDVRPVVCANHAGGSSPSEGRGSTRSDDVGVGFKGVSCWSRKASRCVGIESERGVGGEKRRERKSLRIGVHHADAVVLYGNQCVISERA